MKRLFLLRHGKAGFGTNDMSRPLAPRGTHDILWLGKYLKEQKLLPDHILCSESARTQQTSAQLQKGAEIEISTSLQNNLYLASAETIAQNICRCEADLNAIMVIGHNPGLSILFQSLALKTPQNPRILKYPTGALAILDFDMDSWDQLQNKKGQLIKFIIPSDNMRPSDNMGPSNETG